MRVLFQSRRFLMLVGLLVVVSLKVFWGGGAGAGVLKDGTGQTTGVLEDKGVVLQGQGVATTGGEGEKKGVPVIGVPPIVPIVVQGQVEEARRVQQVQVVQGQNPPLRVVRFPEVPMIPNFGAKGAREGVSPSGGLLPENKEEVVKKDSEMNIEVEKKGDISMMSDGKVVGGDRAEEQIRFELKKK